MDSHLKRIVTRITASLLVVAASFWLAAASHAQERVINTRVGLVNAYENAAAALSSGAGYEIVRFRWDELQPNGPADWNAEGPTGDWVEQASSVGREVVGVLLGTPGWATSDTPGVGVPTGLYLPVNDPGNLWAGFVRQAVSYYAARGINHWVIWEDMDIPAGRSGTQWAGTVGDYYQLVKVADLVATQANPNAVIHLGGVGSFDPTWFNRFLDVAVDDPTGAANDYYFDIASLNIFYAPDRVGTQTANFFFVMGSKGVALKPVWINQANARPAIDEVYPDDASFRDFSRVTVEQQAAFIIQAYAEGFAAGADRITTYRLVDNLPEDGLQAFGLMRADGSARPAYTAYQIAAEQFNGFVFARNVNEEANPLTDYVRLTFAEKVTHIVWARTEQNATLIIPARSTQAMLIDIHNNRWEVTPQGGSYRIAVEGATCNEPSAPAGCMIGGPPWILVEEGVTNALSETPPSVEVEQGGIPPTPDPSFALTATARALPTPTPTLPPTATATSLPAPEVTAAIEVPPTEVAVTAEGVATTLPPPPVEATQIPPSTDIPLPTLAPIPNFLPGQPHGIITVVPFLLIGLGVLAIGGGATYYLTDGFATLQREDAEWDEIAGEEQEEWDSVLDEDEAPDDSGYMDDENYDSDNHFEEADEGPYADEDYDDELVDDQAYDEDDES